MIPRMKVNESKTWTMFWCLQTLDHVHSFSQLKMKVEIKSREKKMKKRQSNRLATSIVAFLLGARAQRSHLRCTFQFSYSLCLICLFVAPCLCRLLPTSPKVIFPTHFFASDHEFIIPQTGLFVGVFSCQLSSSSIVVRESFHKKN